MGDGSYFLVPANKLEIIVTKSDYQNYYDHYLENLSNMVLQGEDIYNMAQSHYSLLTMASYNSPFESTISLIPPCNDFTFYYYPGAINSAETINVEGSLPESMISTGNNFISHYKENEGLDKIKAPNLKLLRDEYVQIGWYDRDDRLVWDFETDVTNEDLHLESIWVPQTEVDNYFVNVSFDPQNGDDVTTNEILQGSKVRKPLDPLYANHSFTEWTLDQEHLIKWEFETPLTDDIVLYGQWLAKDVRVDFVDGDFTTSITILYNTVIPETDIPLHKNIIDKFLGWHTQTDEMGKWFNPNEPITDDLTVYAIYEKLIIPDEDKNIPPVTVPPTHDEAEDIPSKDPITKIEVDKTLPNTGVGDSNIVKIGGFILLFGILLLGLKLNGKITEIEIKK